MKSTDAIDTIKAALTLKYPDLGFSLLMERGYKKAVLHIKYENGPETSEIAAIARELGGTFEEDQESTGIICVSDGEPPFTHDAKTAFVFDDSFGYVMIARTVKTA